MIETRVKENKAQSIRDKLCLKGQFLDNYNYHGNGRLWIEWDDAKVDIKHIRSSCQYIHCGVYDKAGHFKFWLTAIYAHNQLHMRKKLWKDPEDIHNTQQGPWCAIGDYNNVAKSQDRIGGNMVTEAEYEDMQAMMDFAGMSEMDSSDEFFTWTNKQVGNPIYYRIDRVLANIDWFQKHSDVTLTVLPPHVSDHGILYLSAPAATAKSKQFRFNNCWVDAIGYQEVVEASWCQPARGTPMQRLWYKLHQLRLKLLQLNKLTNDVQLKKTEARQKLDQAYQDLSSNRMNVALIETVKNLTEEVIHWNEMEEKMMMQRTKVDWIRLGDGNNAYFHAYLKSRLNTKRISVIQRGDGTILTDQKDIAQEVIHFYGQLMGHESDSLQHVDIEALRNGSQLTLSQREELVRPIAVKEIEEALYGIGDLKSPGVDGYSSKFFKSCWRIVKDDVVKAAQEFFEQMMLFTPFNQTVVTLVPKYEGAKSVKDFRPIAGCSTFYKILSKVLTARLGKVLPSVISLS
ncbi:hypothetical protein QL285_019443 [Trifolium repens]|nr:hypothetical protein QL285_019443 [Trifolium repens]